MCAEALLTLLSVFCIAEQDEKNYLCFAIGYDLAHGTKRAVTVVMLYKDWLEVSGGRIPNSPPGHCDGS